MAYVDLGLHPGNVRFELFSPLFKGLIELAESHAVQLAVLIETIDPANFLLRFLEFCLLVPEHVFLLSNRVVSLFQICRDFVCGKGIVLDFIGENPFEIDDCDFVMTASTDIFRTVRWHIHLLSALAMGNSRENMDRLLCRPALLLVSLVNDLIALLPFLN